MCWDNSLKKEKSLSTARIKKDANFQITVEKLKELMDARTTEGVEKLDKLYGGVGNLAKMLNVDLNEGKTFVVSVCVCVSLSVSVCICGETSSLQTFFY